MDLKRLTYIFLLLTTATVHAQDVSVKAYLDRTNVGLNQQFTLHVELSGSGANKAGSPQLPDMKSFAAFLGSGSSQNFQFINGKTTVSRTISYHHQAIKEGTHIIGAVTVKAGNKTLKTKPINITIKKGAAQQPSNQQPGVSGPSAEELFLKASVIKRRVYQNEPVIITYKIYTSVNVTSYHLSKLPATAGFWVEEYDLGQVRPVREIVNGRQYTVATIKRMAVFPMASGARTVEPMAITCDIQVQRKRRDIFDSFFSDPFGKPVSKVINSNPVKIEVLPLPDEGKPPGFKGSVGVYTMKSTLDKTSVKTNEALTFRLTIEGKGNIQALTEPSIQFPADFEVYPPKTTKNIKRGDTGITGHKTFEYVLIPRIPGAQKIKPVVFSFFNTDKRAYETLKTDERLIAVAKGEDVLAVIPGGLTRKEVNLLGEDIRFIKTENSVMQKIGEGFIRKAGFWAAAVIPLLALMGAFAFRRHQDKLLDDVAYARDRRATGIARKRLAVARSHLDSASQSKFYADIGRALTGYLADKQNFAEAGMISGQVKEKLTKQGITGSVIEDYFNCLETCDMIRFSPTESTLEEMKQFLKMAEDAMNALDREMAKS